MGSILLISILCPVRARLWHTAHIIFGTTHQQCTGILQGLQHWQHTRDASNLGACQGAQQTAATALLHTTPSAQNCATIHIYLSFLTRN